MSNIAIYDQARVELLLRDETPHGLLAHLRGGVFGQRLSPAQAHELEGLLIDWEQRALGLMPLRDALMVDNARGQRAHALICTALTTERAPVANELAALMPAAPALLRCLPAELRISSALTQLGDRAAQAGLTLVWQALPDEFPPPEGLERLTPPPPVGYPHPDDTFEPPIGWRRWAAVALAAGGVIWLLLPLLTGQIPERPAGPPLAMLTLALMVGIRAGWAGSLGALCLWLVANLPAFRHGTSLISLWPALPLMGFGLLLLGLDRRVRAVLRWFRRELRIKGGGL